ncbi:TRAP transporter large permease subunit [Virgibacillus sp. W0181]|uniref:TRAP transporter large permease subunit n=1 Tax=Virgibacillus sp. W0181 TaxID=3391581 RepID=UPI003F46CCFB
MTPPVVMNLFAAHCISNVSIERLTIKFFPMIVVLLICLILFIFFSQIVFTEFIR